MNELNFKKNDLKKAIRSQISIQVYYKKEPILEDFESIQKGMTVYEVVEIIGIPSDYSTTSSGMEHYVSYDVDENTKFTVIFVDKLNELNLVNDTKFYEK